MQQSQLEFYRVLLAFAKLHECDATVWWNLSTSVALLAGRYLPLIALLLLAEGMAHKQPVPETTATLRTDTGMFTGITAGVILILGALTFLPVFVLGPIDRRSFPNCQNCFRSCLGMGGWGDKEKLKLFLPNSSLSFLLISFLCALCVSAVFLNR